MKAVAFDYQRARDAAEALQLLRASSDNNTNTGTNIKLLAGGQSLGPMLNLRLVRPTLLIDVSRSTDLRAVSAEPDALVYGAAITHADIEDGRVDDVSGGWLRAAARRIAYRAVRNRGTLGGSLVHADPAADWPAILLALGGEVIIQSEQGMRSQTLQQFYPTAFSTALGQHEIVCAVRVPRPSSGARWGYYKYCVKHGEFAKAIGAVLHDPERGVTRAVAAALDRPPLLFNTADAEALLQQPDCAEALLRQQLPSLGGAALRLHAVALSRAARAASPEHSSASAA